MGFVSTAGQARLAVAEREKEAIRSGLPHHSFSHEYAVAT